MKNKKESTKSQKVYRFLMLLCYIIIPAIQFFAVYILTKKKCTTKIEGELNGIPYKIYGENTKEAKELKKQKLITSLVCACTPVYLLSDSSNIITIIVDNIFMLLPEDVQKYIIAHEIGHHVVKEADPNNGQDVYTEFAADAYCAHVYGKKALIKMSLYTILISYSGQTVARFFKALFTSSSDPLKRYNLKKNFTADNK